MVVDKMNHGTGDNYETPGALFEALDLLFDFGLDAFVSEDNKKCCRYYSEENSALTQDWYEQDSVWMNPQYSRGLIYEYMAQAYRQSMMGLDRMIVTLVRDDPTTKWYEDFIDGKADQVWRLKH